MALMRRLIPAFLALRPLVYASQTVFSVHDDLFAFPQYEVIFSDSLISDRLAESLLGAALPQTEQTQSIAPQSTHDASDPEDVVRETYEMMSLGGEQYLCAIPTIAPYVVNETLAAEARAAEQKELARATDRGWELLQDLEGSCLYFVAGWWSYAFCYNADITQYHPLPPQPGKPQLPPRRDPSSKQYVLGRVKKVRTGNEDEWGNQIEVHQHDKAGPSTELQMKGDTRYLVQRMEGGDICDLTGKHRRIEIQYHCNPQVTDRIGYIREVTTCSYVMVVYTPRLCNDVAFMPPKETKAHAITCRIVVPEAELAERLQIQGTDTGSCDAKAPTLEATSAESEPINIGGVIVGAGKWVDKSGARMPIPPNFGQQETSHVQTIALGQRQAEGGKVEMMSEEDLAKLDLDLDVVDELRREVEGMAEGHAWRIEVVDAPGRQREILGIVEEDEEPDETPLQEGTQPGRPGEGDDEDTEGSEEVYYKDEL